MSVYRVTEVIGTSTESWEHAARSAVETAAATVREIRVAEVTRQDVTIENGQVSGSRSSGRQRHGYSLVNSTNRPMRLQRAVIVLVARPRASI